MQMHKTIIATFGLLSCSLAHTAEFLWPRSAPQSQGMNHQLNSPGPAPQAINLGAARTTEPKIPTISCTCCLRSASLMSFARACVSLGYAPSCCGCCLPLACAACLGLLSGLGEDSDQLDRAEMRGLEEIIKHAENPKKLYQLLEQWAGAFSQERLEMLQRQWERPSASNRLIRWFGRTE